MEKRKSYPSQASLGKRALMLLLSIAMVLTMMPLLPGYVDEANAAATYDIQFNANGGTGKMDDLPMVYGTAKFLTANDFTRTGYTFKEWNRSADGSGTAYTDEESVNNLTTINNETVTLYAQWKANTYTIKFRDGYSYSGTMDDQSMTYDQEEELAECGFTRQTYIFRGWNTEPDGSGTAYADKESVKNLTATNNGTVILYAQWEDTNKDRVIIDLFSGREYVATIHTRLGVDTPLPDYALSKTGYRFVGWTDTNGRLYTDMLPSSALSELADYVIGLEAEWEANTYTVKFDSNTGAGPSMDDLAMTYDVAKLLPVNRYTNQDYTFTGWNTKPDGSGTAYTDEEAVKNLTATNEDTVTLYAQWSHGTPGNIYKVRFDANGAPGVMSPLLMTYGEIKALPANEFTRTGYTFKGWNRSADGSGTAYIDKQFVKNLTATNNGTVTMYAQWDAKKYTITYEDVDTEDWKYVGSGEDIVDTVTMGDNWTMRGVDTYTRHGYHYVSWKWIGGVGDDGHVHSGEWNNGLSKPPWDIATNVTAKPRWIPNTYTITFNGNTGTGTMSDLSMTYDKKKTLPANTYIKDGFVFAGWNTEADGSGTAYSEGQSIQNLTANNKDTVTLYAQWRVGDYAIVFNPGPHDDTMGTMPSLVMGKDEEKALPANAFTRSGYTFDGWRCLKDGENYVDRQVVKNLANSGVVVLQASWRRNKCTIKFNANGGTGTMDDLDAFYKEVFSVPLNVYTKTDCIFTGWNTKADGSGTEYRQGFSYILKDQVATNSDTITLYAQWMEEQYIISFSPCYSVEETMPPLILKKDEEKALPNNIFNNKGYTFSGWNSKSDGRGVSYAEGQVIKNPDGMDRLYAQWTPNTYKVKFDANGGAGTPMGDLSMTYNKDKVLTANTYIMDGHIFIGWNTKIDGSGVAYTDEESVKNLTATNNATVILYAQWLPKVTIEGIPAQTYTGQPIEPPLTVEEEQKLIPGVDYDVVYSDNIQPGRAKATVTFKGSYSGITTVEFIIKASNYTVKFNANGGTGNMADLAMVSGTAKSLRANAFTRTGYTFTGWNTKADGSGTVYTDGQSVNNLTIKNNDTVTLYAQWLPKELVVDPVADQNYTGEKIEPPLTVKIAGKPLTPKVDYDVVYSDNIQPGTAKATVTLKGGYTGTKTIEFTIKTPLKAKGLWVSKHENTYVTFNWTGTPNNNLATGWDVQYRTKLIGTQYAWSKWTSSRESGQTLSKRIYLKPNHTIEFKAKHETDTAYLRSVFTTPAGGKYQSITRCRVKVVATDSGSAYRQGTKTLSLQPGVNFAGDTGNIIYIKKGKSIKITPNHVYPRSKYSKYPRLYPNHAWYDVADSSVISLTGMNSTAGMKDSAITIKGLKAGTTTIKITSCNGRGATLTIVVK